MRYTTLIDIRGTKAYASPSVRLLYIHLVLASGYHAEDLDQVRVSIRGLAEQTRLSVSAVRHGLKVLAKLNLVSREGDHLRVAKYVVQDGIPKRARTKKEQHLQNQAREREQEQQERRRREIQEQAEIIAKYLTKEDLEEWLENCRRRDEDAIVYQKGCKVINNEQGRRYITEWIKRKTEERRE